VRLTVDATDVGADADVDVEAADDAGADWSDATSFPPAAPSEVDALAISCVDGLPSRFTLARRVS